MNKKGILITSGAAYTGSHNVLKLNNSVLVSSANFFKKPAFD